MHSPPKLKKNAQKGRGISVLLLHMPFVISIRGVAHFGMVIMPSNAENKMIYALITAMLLTALSVALQSALVKLIEFDASFFLFKDLSGKRKRAMIMEERTQEVNRITPAVELL